MNAPLRSYVVVVVMLLSSLSSLSSLNKKKLMLIGIALGMDWDCFGNGIFYKPFKLVIPRVCGFRCFGNGLGMDWDCFGIALGGCEAQFDAIPFIFYLKTEHTFVFKKEGLLVLHPNNHRRKCI